MSTINEDRPAKALHMKMEKPEGKSQDGGLPLVGCFEDTAVPSN